MRKLSTCFLAACAAALFVLVTSTTRIARGDDASGEKGKSVTMPFVIYGDAVKDPPYIWSGWMGDIPSIAIDPACSDNPHSGNACMKCEFKAITGYGGVVWQNPANDWGDQPGGFDLTAATKLTFWARGDTGGEVVTFKMGILGKTAKHPDSGSAGLENVTLTKDWKQYTIDLKGQDLTDIKTGFMWLAASTGKPVAFFLDDVQYE